MSESSEGQPGRPMIGSIVKFVSDWMGGEGRQPPPFRPRRDEGVMEMQPLVQESRGPFRDLVSDDGMKAWRDIRNVDAFLEQVYAYYEGNGLYGIIVRRTMSMLIIGFLVAFSLFLMYAVDWRFVHEPATAAKHPRLANVIHLSGLLSMPVVIWLALLAFIAVWCMQWARLIQDLPNLCKMKEFYGKTLGIPESEIQSLEFGEVMEKIMHLQERHRISADRLDARDICNRLMRRENYLVALFNKEVFNVDLPLRIKPSLTLTKTLEWNLSFCVLNYFFDDAAGSGGIRKSLLKDIRKDRLSTDLKRRFIAVGVANLLLSPFIFIMLLAYLLFKYGEEIYRNPRTIATRQYTTAARWKLREFNDLPHLFERRLAHSHTKANKYMEQFGVSRWTPIAKFVAFVAGSLAVVLLALTIVNEDLLMHFEISTGKSVIWYLGLMGAILAIAKALIPDATRSNDPARLMESIIQYTHYQPKHWRGKLHTQQVHKEFSRMYDYKFLILLNELISVITTPFILMFALPASSERIVDFFREFTVHVDGLGHVCSFALFDFERHGNPKYGGALAAGSKHNLTRQGKMEKSFLSFVFNNPAWKPDELGSRYLDRIEEFSRQSPQMRTHNSKPPIVPSLRRSPLSYRDRNEEDGNGPPEPEGPGGLLSILDRYYNNKSVRFD